MELWTQGIPVIVRGWLWWAGWQQLKSEVKKSQTLHRELAWAFCYFANVNRMLMRGCHSSTIGVICCLPYTMYGNSKVLIHYTCRPACFLQITHRYTNLLKRNHSSLLLRHSSMVAMTAIRISSSIGVATCRQQSSTARHAQTPKNKHTKHKTIFFLTAILITDEDSFIVKCTTINFNVNTWLVK